MQGSLARPTWLAAILGAALAAPLVATEVYVPVLSPVTNDGARSETEVWVSNPGTAQASYAALVLPVNSDGTQRATGGSSNPIPGGRTAQITKIAVTGKVGLLALELGNGLTADARIVSTTTSGALAFGRVPVISDANKLAAGSKAELLGLERDPEHGRIVGVGFVNLGRQPAQCTVAFFRADTVQISSTVTLTLKALSLLHFDDALGILGVGRDTAVREEVSCNQPFYAYAAQFSWPNSHYLFIGPATQPGASGGGGGTPPVTNPTSIVFDKAGLVHAATAANPKGKVQVTVPRALTLKRLILDWEVVPGPWNLEKIPGNHALIWLYRGKFRGNTIANVNAFGPNRFTVKFAQNIDLGAGSLTSGEKGITLQQGQRYHVHYVYDAEKALVTGQVSSGGTVLISASFAATGGHLLTIPASGLNCEFGHYFGQPGPEVATPGWTYHDLHVEMVPQ